MKIYFMGICGTAMGNAALLAREAGHEVLGADTGVYPPMSTVLAEAGIALHEGYDPARLEKLAPDLVVIGNAMSRGNPEVEWLLDTRALPFASLPQLLHDLVLRTRRNIVVAGTHGKTTTTSLAAFLLREAQADPGWLIGGVPLDPPTGTNLGAAGGPFVIEGDEYDSAFFNKVSKFQHYRPNSAILTSIEFDHADIFADLAAIKRSFAEFIGRIPVRGALVAHLDDPVVAELAREARCPVIGYGAGNGCEWRYDDFEPRGLASEFSVFRRGQLQGRCRLPMPGHHNALNALAVIALLTRLGFPFASIAAGLGSFEGVKRRQQVRGVVGGVTVIDDFAHHPTAVRETLQALRLAWPDSRLVVVFEPRTNSSRRAVFQEDYAGVFGDADRIFIRAHVPLDTVPADEQFSSARLAGDLRARGLQAEACADTDAILDALAGSCRSGDVVAILSNGGFDNIHERLLARLGQAG